MTNQPLNYLAVYTDQNGVERRLHFHGETRPLARDHAEYVAKAEGLSLKNFRYLATHERPATLAEADTL